MVFGASTLDFLSDHDLYVSHIHPSYVCQWIAKFIWQYYGIELQIFRIAKTCKGFPAPPGAPLAWRDVNFPAVRGGK